MLLWFLYIKNCRKGIKKLLSSELGTPVPPVEKTDKYTSQFTSFYIANTGELKASLVMMK